jgi:hypothetical protein
LLIVPEAEVMVRSSVALIPETFIEPPVPVPPGTAKFAVFPAVKRAVNGPPGLFPHFAADNELPSPAKYWSAAVTIYRGIASAAAARQMQIINDSG